MRTVLVAFGLVALCAGSAAASDCHVDSYQFQFGVDAQTHMAVKTGFACTSGFRIRGGGINAMKVSQQAQHGIAAVAGTHRWAYRSAPGYVGHDAFIIQIAGQTMGRFVHDGATNISVDVDVTH